MMDVIAHDKELARNLNALYTMSADDVSVSPSGLEPRVVLC